MKLQKQIGILGRWGRGEIADVSEAAADEIGETKIGQLGKEIGTV